VRIRGLWLGLAPILAISSVDAAVIDVTSSGSTPLGAAPGSNYITFEDVLVGTTGNITSNGFAFTGQGGVFNTTAASGGSIHLVPKFDATNFFAIGFDASNRTATLALASDYTKFGVYWGSIDLSNSITFYNNDVQVYAISGGQVPGFAAQNENANPLTSNPRNQYVNITFNDGIAFDKVVFTNGTTRAFEIDNIALAGSPVSAVPELSTWLMMIVGFAGVGGLAYRRSRRKVTAISA
jgi:hypothetical protein